MRFVRALEPRGTDLPAFAMLNVLTKVRAIATPRLRTQFVDARQSRTTRCGEGVTMIMRVMSEGGVTETSRSPVMKSGQRSTSTRVRIVLFYGATSLSG